MAIQAGVELIIITLKQLYGISIEIPHYSRYNMYIYVYKAVYVGVYKINFN